MLKQPISFGADNMMGMIRYSRLELFDICLRNNPQRIQQRRLATMFQPGIDPSKIPADMLSHCDDVLIGGLFDKILICYSLKVINCKIGALSI